MQYIYRVFTSQNLAETWRDSDDFVENDLGYFTSLEKAESFIKNYISYSYSRFGVKINVTDEVKFNKNGLWYWTNGGSFAVAYVIKREVLE